MTGRVLTHRALAAEFLMTSKIDQLQPRALADLGQGCPHRRILMRRKYGRLRDYRLVADLPALLLPALVVGIEDKYVAPSQVFEDPREHRGVLPFGRVVKHGHRAV